MLNQTIIAAGSTLLGLMLIAALLGRKDVARPANYFLASSLACSICYLVTLALLGNDWWETSILPTVIGYLYLLTSPLLTLYVKALTQPKKNYSVHDLIHLAPYVCLVFLALGPLEQIRLNSNAIAAARGGWPPSSTFLVSLYAYIIPIGYHSRSLILIARHRKKIVDEFSYDENITLGWLGILVGISWLFAFSGLGLGLIRLLPGVELWPRTIYSMSTIIATYYLTAFMGIFQPAVFSEKRKMSGEKSDHNVTLLERLTEANTPPKAKYENTKLTQEEERLYWERLQRLMEEERPYLDSHLRIVDMAELAEIPEHHLSQTINRHAGINFYEFVNRYRVDAVKVMLQDVDRPINMVALEAGFNSQSAFYRQFKDIVGMTPKQYRRQSVDGS
jgi:AraC-like DNA-binding protein